MKDLKEGGAKDAAAEKAVFCLKQGGGQMLFHWKISDKAAL